MSKDFLQSKRENFIERLHQEFMIEKGYGAFVFLTTYSVIMLFDEFLVQEKPEKDFIKEYVACFAKGRAMKSIAQSVS